MRTWLGIWLLALGALVVGSDVHSVAGLLPAMADSLGVSVAIAGQSVTVFAIAYAVLSPTLTIALSRFEPRTLLMMALIVFAVGNAASAIAPTMPVLLAGRVIAAAGAALFTPTAGALAAALVPRGRRGTALGIVLAGASSALVIGAPAGAAIAAGSSWRLTLGIIAAFGLVMVVPLLAMPTAPRIEQASSLRGFSIPRAPEAMTTLGITVVAFAGIFIPYTYMSGAYAPLIAALPGGISTALLIFGVASVAGALASGPISDRVSPRWMVVAVAGTLAFVDVFVVVFRSSPPVLFVALLLAGYLSWSVLTPQQRQLLDLAPERASTLIALNASAGYLGIAAAGALGAAALSSLGAAYFTAVACVLLAAAALWRACKRGARAGATTA